jgi:multidrug transporter EmrE-like cation transporter
MAYVLFDERLDAVSIAGMLVCAAGVVLVNRR